MSYCHFKGGTIYYLNSTYVKYNYTSVCFKLSMINFAQSMLMYNVYYAMCIILYSNNGKYEKQRNSAEQNSHAPKSYYTATI